MGEGKLKAQLNKLIVRLKSDKKLEFRLYTAMAILCALLCLPTFYKEKSGSSDKETAYAAAYEKYNEQEALENRLMETLSCIRGAGKVKVMITYDTGTEIVPAMNTDVAVSTSESNSGNENRTESSKPVTVYRNGEDQAVVIMEKMPQVRGVIVVAEGAGDISVKLKLQSAVQAVLGVEASRVEVLEMGNIKTEE